MSRVMVRPGQADAELAGRKLARRHLVDFMEYVSPWYHAARHHRLIAEKLELVELYIRSKGKEGIGRLLISVPPRHGKTEMVSRHFPAWVLGRLPDTRVILSSYGANLATDNSRACRGLVMHARYANVFGAKGTLTPPNPLAPFPEREGGMAAVELSSDSRSVEAWDLAAPNRGGVVATGVGGGITGKGAHLMIIDDPFKNRKEAESETYRRDVWEWWTSTARTRLEDGGAVIGMFTRWHADDWAGRLLRNMVSNPKAERWTPMTLMAVWESVDSGQWAVGSGQRKEGSGQWVVGSGQQATFNAKSFEEYQREQLLNGSWVEREDPLGRKAGEALWPEKYNADDLAMIREAVGPYDWEALYQQRPYSRQGNMFRREWFSIVEEGPKEAVVRVRAWDKAGTAGGGAFTSGVCMSRTVNGLVYVEHVVRGQWSQFQREEEMLRTARLDAEMRPGPTVIWHPQDPGSAGKDSAQSTNEKMANAGFEAHFEPVTGDKEVRAGPWSSALEAGIVRLVRGGWNEAFIEEHVAFPMSRFKDQVDASSDAYEKVRVGDPYGGIHV